MAQGIKKTLGNIAKDLEEIIGIALGEAPPHFYDESEDGQEVIIMSEARVFARQADKAYSQLLELIASLPNDR